MIPIKPFRDLDELCRVEIVAYVQHEQKIRILPECEKDSRLFDLAEMINCGVPWHDLADWCEVNGEPGVALLYRRAARAYDAATC